MEATIDKPKLVIEDFKNQFFPLLEEINSFSNRNVKFFRGHGQSDWEVIPEIGRPEYSGLRDLKLEYAMFCEYEASAHKMIKDLSAWNILFSMRHHGLPTRLLDWTDSINVALFFALRGFEELAKIRPFGELKNPCVWMLDEKRLNAEAGESGIVLSKSNNRFTYELFLKSHEEKNEKLFPADVIALFPEKSNERLLAQGGFFTFHKNLMPLEKLKREFLLKIEIDKSQISLLDCYLDDMGMREYYLFPDLDGLARYLKRRYKKLKFPT